MSPFARATSVVVLLLASASTAAAQDQVSIDDFGKLSLSVSAEKGTKTNVPLPDFGLYKWRDELHDLATAPASLPASFYSELRTLLASHPKCSAKLPAVDAGGAQRFPFRLRFKPQKADPIDVSGLLLYSEKQFSVPKDTAYDPVRPVLELLLAQWERQRATGEERAKSQVGFARLQDGELVFLDDEYRVKPGEAFALETADASLGRLLATLEGRTVPVRVIVDAEKKTARVLSVLARSKEWEAPVTAADGSRIAQVRTLYDKSETGLEVTGVDANGAPTVWTPVGPGSLPASLVTVSADPKPGRFFAPWATRVETLELSDLVAKMPAPSRTPGVLGAFDRR